MITIQSAQTEIIFGSQCRGDSDQHSDKDILIIDNDGDILSKRSKELINQGYSVASYTWSRFRNMVEQKSLFIQHLKMEGHIVIDLTGEASSLIYNFSPACSYQNELKINNSLFKLVDTYPNIKSGKLLAIDIIYVALRNFGVLSLAEKGKYIFSYEKILEALSDENVIECHDISKLLKIRWMKALYRNRNVVPNHELDILLQDLPRILGNIVPLGLVPFSPISFLGNLKEDRKVQSSCIYETLRRIEKYYIAAIAVSPSIKKNIKFENIRKYIENPRAYSLNASLEKNDIYDNLINEISILLENNHEYKAVINNSNLSVNLF